MNVSLKRWDEWVELADSGLEGWSLAVLDETEVVFVQCPNGHIGPITGIADGWEISEAGEVTPSVHCLTPVEGSVLCGWHVFVTLEGWEE